MDQARKLKFSSYVHLPSIYKQNVSVSLRLSDPVQCWIGFSEHGRYISTLEYIRMVIFSSNVLLACINTIYKHGHAWVI